MYHTSEAFIEEKGKIELQLEEVHDSCFRKEKQNKNKAKHWLKKESEEMQLKT